MKLTAKQFYRIFWKENNTMTTPLWKCMEAYHKYNQDESANKEQWKDVKEVEPPNIGTIMFYTDCLRNPTDTWIGVYREGEYHSCGTQVNNVTHWMNVPEPPKE